MGDEGGTRRSMHPTARKNLRLDRRRMSKRSSITSELERLPIPRQLKIPAPDFAFTQKRPYRPFPINRPGIHPSIEFLVVEQRRERVVAVANRQPHRDRIL